MASTSSQRSRRADLRNRISDDKGALARCVVLGCEQPTAARARRGLNRHYCQRHVQHYRRHGSYSKPSYSAGQLNPHRRAAQAWLQANSGLTEVRTAAEGVRALYARAGRSEEAFRLAGKSPSERARYVWARLRSDEVDPLRVLSIWMAVQLCHRSDPQPERKPEYRWVQAAKVLHRMAGGSHKRWEREDASGQVRVTILRKYPASRGRVLRHIGQSLDESARGLLPIIPTLT